MFLFKNHNRMKSVNQISSANHLHFYNNNQNEADARNIYWVVKIEINIWFPKKCIQLFELEKQYTKEETGTITKCH